MPRSGVVQERRCRTPGAGVIHEDVPTDMCGTSARVLELPGAAQASVILWLTGASVQHGSSRFLT